MAGPGKRGTQTKKGKQIWLEIAALISSIPSKGTFGTILEL